MNQKKMIIKKKIILRKFHHILFLNLSSDGDVFFNFYSDTTMTFFLIDIFYSMCMKNTMLSF